MLGSPREPWPLGQVEALERFYGMGTWETKAEAVGCKVPLTLHPCKQSPRTSGLFGSGPRTQRWETTEMSHPASKHPPQHRQTWDLGGTELAGGGGHGPCTRASSAPNSRSRGWRQTPRDVGIPAAMTLAVCGALLGWGSAKESARRSGCENPATRPRPRSGHRKGRQDVSYRQVKGVAGVCPGATRHLL